MSRNASVREEEKARAPRLSMAVQGSMGPIVEGEFPKSKEFGKTIAAKLKT